MSTPVKLLLIPLAFLSATLAFDGTRPATPASRPARPSAPPAPRLTDADYDAHVAALKKRLPRGFNVVVEKPFIVVGDESAATVRRRAIDTVRWSVERLKRAYFDKDPDEIIDIWLFKDKASYEKHTAEIFNDTPTTPFGYYSPTHKALIMNIATGGGTLVHEIVHPFVRANFPDCPAWFNEGLGSLYEQCDDRDGHIWGLTNWRLAGLQETIRRKKLPTFKKLLSTTDNEFYNDDKGTNYAQARYLCYYLQEKGLLTKYYRAFHAARRVDPTGYETLRKTLGDAGQDMTAFQKSWEKFVSELTFP